MNDFVLQMADLKIHIIPLYDSIQFHCKEYVVSSDHWDFEVTTTPEDVEYEKQAKLKEVPEDEAPSWQNVPLSFFEMNAVYRKIADRLSDYDAILFHGSVVAADGKAYVFSAKSGTGKSTHTSLWLKNVPGSFIVNGDKPIIRIFPDKILVYGTPWAGKEGLQTNTSVPLKAICLLQRGKQNKIRRIPFRDALSNLLQQTYRPNDRSKLVKTLHLLGEFSKRVLMYELSCNMEDEAAKIAYEAMRDR